MKLITGRDIPLCFLYDTPTYVYVIRLWLDDVVDGQSTQSKVVVFKSNSPLQPNELFDQLVDSIGEKQAKKSHLIDIQPDADVVLDTWEPEVEVGYSHGDECRTQVYKNWWSADDCVVVAGEELTK